MDEIEACDVKTKLTLADTVVLDPAGRLTVDGEALDAAPEYAGMLRLVCRRRPLRGWSTNRIAFTAVAPSGADPSPVVRTVFLPVGSDKLWRTSAWKARSSSAALYGRYLSTYKYGQKVGAYRSGVKRIALVVTKAPKSGKVHVYFAGKRITRKPISLASSRYAGKVLIPVKTFSTPRAGTVKVKVVSRGKRVRVEGIGIATR